MVAHTFEFEKFIINGVDDTNNPTSAIITANTNVVAVYKEENILGTQPLKGEVSAQSGAGEVVTITITKPDLTEEIISAVTTVNLEFSASYSNVPGNYTAIARIGEDDLYLAAVSASFAFGLTKEVRTITLHG